MKKSKLNMKKTLIMFALIPLTVGLTAFSLIASYMLSHEIEKDIKEELVVGSAAIKEYYDYDLKNMNDLEDGFISYDHEYIDKMAKNGIDFTVFKENVRFMTTIIDKNTGKRIEGTNASEAVWAAVSAGKDYYSDDVVINDIDYYVYYKPLSGPNGEVVGMAFAGKPCTQVVAAKRNLYLNIAIFAVLLEGVFLLVSWLISKKISKPINDVAENIKALSEGQINIDVETDSHIAETITLIGAAKTLSEVLRDSIAKIKSNTSTLNDAIETTSDLAKESSAGTSQITDAMNGLAQTTETMANSVQDVNTSILDMGNMIDGIVANADNLGASSKKMAEAGNEATKCIDNMSASSERSSNAIQSITEKIESTNESVQKIDEMVNLITDIASQTNLLSLNASIEAARAGDAGRGFGVVATEIKSLAEQSAQSAEKIMAVVNEISTQSSECVEQSRQVKGLIEEEQGLLAVTKEKFGILENEIEASVSEIQAVTLATEQLNSAKTTITEAVSDLSAISEETSATNQEVSASISLISENVKRVSEDSDRMNDLSGQLKEAVAYFK